MWVKQRTEQWDWALDWLWKLDSTAGLSTETSCFSGVLHVKCADRFCHWLVSALSHSGYQLLCFKIAQANTGFCLLGKFLCCPLSMHICWQHLDSSYFFPQTGWVDQPMGLPWCVTVCNAQMQSNQIGVLSQFFAALKHLEVISKRKKCVSAGGVNLQVWQPMVVQYWHWAAQHMAAYCLWGLHKNDSWVVQIKPKCTTDLAALISNRLMMRDEFKSQEKRCLWVAMMYAIQKDQCLGLQGQVTSMLQTVKPHRK